MRTLKVMSIIGIIISSFAFLGIFGSMGYNYDAEAAAGWGMFLTIYALPFSIVVLVLSIGEKKTEAIPVENLQLLTKLSELREKNLITEEEYVAQKKSLLR